VSERRIRVINMIPKSLSGETNQDSEPQLTVDHEHVRTIVGTAFTPDPGGGPLGPVFASFDHGDTWTLDLVIPGGEPNDQSVRFGSGSALYAGVLRGDHFLRLNLLRSAPYSPSTVMQTEVQRDTIDQPYVAAVHAEGKDRVFVGNNDASSGPYRGSIEHSSDARNAPPPDNFSQNIIDPRLTIRDSPSIRPAPHRGGTVYAAYFSWRQVGPVQADVVVARDDNFATGGAPFSALTDTGDGLAGVRVALSVPIPWFLYIGNERLGSSLSIAVDPTNSHVVYLAWGDGPHPGSQQTLHLRRSADRGVTWSDDLLSVPNATNPALAITVRRKVGFLYQQFVTTPSQRWETHVQVSRNAWTTPAEDIVLASTPVDNATYQFDPYIGDYDDLQAVGHDFYGIFSAHNMPNLSNFPHGVVYQRNADFVTNQLLDVNGVTSVANSIDPFFFHIFWPEEFEEEEREAVIGRERLEIRGLKYEKLEIKELKLESDDYSRSRERDEYDDKLRGVSRMIRRLADRIEDLTRDRGHERYDDDDDRD
jgi:hypothetical protein